MILQNVLVDGGGDEDGKWRMVGGTHWPQVGEAEGGGGRSGRDLGVIVITIVIIINIIIIIIFIDIIITLGGKVEENLSIIVIIAISWCGSGWSSLWSPDDGHEVLCCDIAVVLLVQLVEDLVQNLEIKMMIKRGAAPSSRESRLSYGFCKYIGAKMTNDVGYPPHHLVNTGSWFMYCQVCTLDLR